MPDFKRVLIAVVVSLLAICFVISSAPLWLKALFVAPFAVYQVRKFLRAHHLSLGSLFGLVGGPRDR